jgi:hypothetical protein
MADEHDRFWSWFERNADRLQAAMYGRDEGARENAALQLRDAIEAVEPGLVLEMGQRQKGEPCALIVSADGKPERVDGVKDFVAGAPDVPGWKLFAFRPRMPVHDAIEIRLEDECVSAGDIWFKVRANDAGLDLVLYVRGLTSDNEHLRGLGAALLAEHAIGERDALTLLTSLRAEPLPRPPAAGMRPFAELVRVFDAAIDAKYPPPGRLPIDPDSEWMNMRGTVDGALASIMLHAGLRPIVGHPDYDRRLTVTLPLHEANDEGMPETEEEYEAVCDLGDRIRESLMEGQESLLAMTIMTQGRRDLVFYTSKPRSALKRLHAIERPSHRIEPHVERDTFWTMYRSFCQAGEEGGEGQ